MARPESVRNSEVGAVKRSDIEPAAIVKDHVWPQMKARLQSAVRTFMDEQQLEDPDQWPNRP
jgi:hypothetical protein